MFLLICLESFNLFLHSQKPLTPSICYMMLNVKLLCGVSLILSKPKKIPMFCILCDIWWLATKARLWQKSLTELFPAMFCFENYKPQYLLHHLKKRRAPHWGWIALYTLGSKINQEWSKRADQNTDVSQPKQKWHCWNYVTRRTKTSLQSSILTEKIYNF